MQTLSLVKKGILEWTEAPDPVISGPNQAVVRPLAVARCDLDLPIIHGHTLFRRPFPIGHEFVGEITALSDDVSDLRIGQKVASAFQVSCGACAACMEGHSKACSHPDGGQDFGMGPGGKKFGGALADFIHIPHARQMLLPLKDDTDLVSVASLSDNIVEAWKLAGFYLDQHPGTPVLVVGGLAASIGLYTAGLAVAMGSETLYVDTDEERCERAAALGARVENVTSLPRSLGRQFPLVADAAGTPEGYHFCVRSVAVEGIVTSASIFWNNKFPIPFMDLYVKGATLKIGRVDSREHMPRVLEWIEKGALNARSIVSRTAPWADAREAWMEPGIKLVVTR